MCGIVGVVSPQYQVNQPIFDALTALQHRGQEAAGMMTCSGEQVALRKAGGLVSQVIQPEHMQRLQGDFGIGHVRYPTAGSDYAIEAQPFYVNSPYGLGIVHNGNLVNTTELRSFIKTTARRHLNTDSDSEVLLNLFAHELTQWGNGEVTPENLFKAVSAVCKRCEGGYSVIILIAGVGLLAFRDRFGIRPLVIGQANHGTPSFMFASESVAVDMLDYELIGDVAPGEAVFVDLKGKMIREQCVLETQLSPCLFEYVYFARPDSVINGVSVYDMRLAMGQLLAEKIHRQWQQVPIDVVVPVPDTSTTIALPLAQHLKLPYRHGLIKNRYVGRTFIMPGQAKRKKSIKQKLNAVGSVLKDKRVLLVDDSIVRGNTSKEIIQMVRDKGAKSVYFASAAPEVCYPNLYGIDMPCVSELIAANKKGKDLSDWLGADDVIFQDLSALYQAAKWVGSEIKQFEDSVFSGVYISGHITPAYLTQWSKKRER